MDQRADETVWKRVRGGFRRMAETELGAEQMCMTCKELWPFDKDFFVVSGPRIGYECKACIKDRQ